MEDTVLSCSQMQKYAKVLNLKNNTLKNHFLWDFFVFHLRDFYPPCEEGELDSAEGGRVEPDGVRGDHRAELLKFKIKNLKITLFPGN